MNQLFLQQLILSFLVGAAWVTATTIIAEKFGSKIGGFIGGLPSTVLIALLFIGITQTASAAINATIVIPLTMGVNCIFTLVYLKFVRRGLVTALILAYLAWVVLAGMLVMVNVTQLWVALVGWLLLLIFYLVSVEHYANIPAHGKVIVQYTTGEVLSRGLFAGTIIAVAVLISKIGGPVLGGVFSVFPVIFTSNMVITYRTGGVDFSRAVVKTLVVSAMVNVGVYAIAVHYFYGWLDILWGTVAAITATILTSYLTFIFIRKYLQ